MHATLGIRQHLLYLGLYFFQIRLQCFDILKFPLRFGFFDERLQ